MRSRLKKNGSTLVETLIYTALLGMIAIMVVFVTQTTFYARAKANTVLILQENLQYAMMRTVNRIHTATAITAPLNDSSSTLVLSMADPAENPTTITLSNGVITMSQGNGAAVALTSNEVTITALTFTAAPGTAAGVRINITGRFPGISSPFQSTFSLDGFATIHR